MLFSAGVPATTPSSPSFIPSSRSPASSLSPPKKKQKTSARFPNNWPGKVTMMRIPQPPDSILAVLPVDLFVQILDRLPDSADRKSFRLVSHGFLKAETLHRRALRVLRRESLPFLLRRYSALESLDLSPCSAIDDAALAAAFDIAGSLRTLKNVCLSRATGIGWRGLVALVAACPRLEAVDLSHCVGVGDLEAAALAASLGWRRRESGGSRGRRREGEGSS